MRALKLLLGLSVCLPCYATEWSSVEKLGFSSFVVLEVVDVGQTIRMKRHSEQYKEKNPLYGDDPSIGKVVLVKTLTTSLVYWAVDESSPVSRKVILGLADAIQLSVVAHNYQVGLRFGF